MIASYSNSFIFLKTMKTGGTSVETILSTWCSGRDIVTPFAADDEVVRTQMGGRPMNYGGGLLHSAFSNHSKAVDVRRRLDDLWDKAFKFTVERHPYERVVSLVYWRLHKRGGDPATDFAAELERTLEAKRGVSNRPIYCIDDHIAVDEVIRYEELWPRLGEIAVSMGRTLPAEIPKAKGRFRADRRPARDILSDVQKARIYELTSRDFDDLGFER